MKKEKFTSGGAEKEPGMIEELKALVGENDGEWVVEEPAVIAFYVPQEAVEKIEAALKRHGYASEGDDQDVFAPDGRYMKFRVSGGDQFMFRVTLK